MSSTVRVSDGGSGHDDGLDCRLDRKRWSAQQQAHTFPDTGREILMDVCRRLAEGLVIPAHPLALTSERKLDERRQRALTRYYLAAGVGGVAVGVHTTQFAIRDPQFALYRPVLELAAEEMVGRSELKIAGVAGRTPQAITEAGVARALKYD